MTELKYAMVFGNVRSFLRGVPGTIDRIESAQKLDDRELRRVVARYLDGGFRVGQALGYSEDHFGSGERTSLDTLTDGEWVWPGDAGFYVENYGISPPADLIAKAKRFEGECPSLTDAQQSEVLARYQQDAAS